MNKKIFISVFLILFSLNSLCAQNYFIAFFGENLNPISGSVTGHAFIGIGKGIPLTCDIYEDSTEMFGFYPKIQIQGGKSLWAGPVPGQVKNDVRTDINLYFYQKIEFADYIKVHLKMESWKTKQYQLLRSDCISFFIDIASICPNIKIPDRKTYTLPQNYVYQFIQINKN